MPEMTFTVQWPDGSQQRCYSPSLVMHDYFAVGLQYPVAEFVDRSRSALTIASDRVRAKYGFPCSSAAATMSEIHSAAAMFATGTVTVVEMSGHELVEGGKPLG